MLFELASSNELLLFWKLTDRAFDALTDAAVDRVERTYCWFPIACTHASVDNTFTDKGTNRRIPFACTHVGANTLNYFLDASADSFSNRVLIDWVVPLLR